ncbi:MAG: transporter substrate-binding domain-containing protein, partial [Desulfosarcina sp.]|nr:transporter substrate-binding domain-containing protein [Desulfobacterales bacterium]
IFVFILITTTVFPAISNGQEPLSIRVGAYANHPKIFMNANGKVSGFWPDLIKHIAETENWKIEYTWGTWSDGLDHLINKEIAIMPDVAFTEKRNRLYAFSEAPVLMSWTRVYVNKKNTGIQSITDLKNKKIAALRGSVNLEGVGGLRKIALGFNLNCTFLELDTYKEVFKAVEENRTDAGITNRNFGNKNAKYFKVKKTPVIFQPINVKFAFPKDAELTTYLVERINYHIKKFKQDEHSVYYRLLEKYFEAEIAEKTVEVFPVWLATILKSIMALFFFFILVITASRIQVKKKTNEILVKNEALRESEEQLEKLVEKRTEALQKINIEYAAANKELKEFAHIVSHDLKAPLRAISQLTHWISEDYSGAFDDDGKMQMDLIIKRVKRMDGLIDGILRYSRVGRIREKKERLDLNLLVNEVVDNIAPPDNVRITLENKLPVILRDSIRMEQVFQNLIGNAIKFMDKDKGIIKVGCGDEGAYWKFNVSDNGPGIDKRYHDKVFRIFQTLTPRDEHESTGIGLTLVKKIIALYGGSVWVESEAGRGATFFFTLPKGTSKKGEKDAKL